MHNAVARWVDLYTAFIAGHDPIWAVARKKDTRIRGIWCGGCEKGHEHSRDTFLFRNDTFLHTFVLTVNFERHRGYLYKQNIQM